MGSIKRDDMLRTSLLFKLKWKFGWTQIFSYNFSWSCLLQTEVESWMEANILTELLHESIMNTGTWKGKGGTELWRKASNQPTSKSNEMLQINPPLNEKRFREFREFRVQDQRNPTLKEKRGRQHSMKSSKEPISNEKQGTEKGENSQTGSLPRPWIHFGSLVADPIQPPGPGFVLILVLPGFFAWLCGPLWSPLGLLWLFLGGSWLYVTLHSGFFLPGKPTRNSFTEGNIQHSKFHSGFRGKQTH